MNAAPLISSAASIAPCSRSFPRAPELPVCATSTPMLRTRGPLSQPAIGNADSAPIAVNASSARRGIFMVFPLDTSKGSNVPVEHDASKSYDVS